MLGNNSGRAKQLHSQLFPSRRTILTHGSTKRNNLNLPAIHIQLSSAHSVKVSTRHTSAHQEASRHQQANPLPLLPIQAYHTTSSALSAQETRSWILDQEAKPPSQPTS